ncbi:MAG TPA: glycosyltransferase family 39 protein [Candidatus Angelobacter sp.]
MPKSFPAREPRLFAFQVFFIIFTLIVAAHGPLLRLPFFWDEAGFYVPAAYDLAHHHSLIPVTTADTSHPPLSAAYLALWLTWSGWMPAVARIAMLLLAAFALSNVFLLARRIANTGVAVASTLATALYPVFFVQSSLTHADLAAAAFTLWGIRMAVERRLWISQLAFSLAVLSKETAIFTPLALAVWEFFFSPDATARTKQFSRWPIYLLPALPLAAWLLFHHHATGRFFGSPQFYQYNVAATLSPLRFVLAFGIRLWNLLGFMNMLALTAAMLAAMWFPAVVDHGVARERISIPIQIQFAFIMLANLLAFSLLGGALLTRYLLPLYPLVIIIGMSTLRRRIGRWEWPAALVIICFVLALFFDPPYKISPEDNLTYKDFVDLHLDAGHFLEQYEQGKAILTAWPASDELTRTYLGYINKPLPLVTVQDFTVEEVFKARAMRAQYQVAFVFSTKYNQPTWFHSKTMENLNRRYFDYHTDLPPELIANFLGGKIVFLERKKAEWVAVIEIEEPGTTAANAQVGSTN